MLGSIAMLAEVCRKLTLQFFALRGLLVQARAGCGGAGGKGASLFQREVVIICGFGPGLEPSALERLCCGNETRACRRRLVTLARLLTFAARRAQRVNDKSALIQKEKVRSLARQLRDQLARACIPDVVMRGER